MVMNGVAGEEVVVDVVVLKVVVVGEFVAESVELRKIELNLGVVLAFLKKELHCWFSLLLKSPVSEPLIYF